MAASSIHGGAKLDAVFSMMAKRVCTICEPARHARHARQTCEACEA